jgi:DNA-directed RNA polymerase specialized sigma subunit
MDQLELPKPYSNPQPTSRLEPEFQDVYAQWSAQPTNKAVTGNLLKALTPTIDKAIKAHVGDPHPLIQSRARNIVLKSLPKYDPKQTQLNTYITNQLYSLRRVNRKQTQIIRVPERLAQEYTKLNVAEENLRDRLGREPTTLELADDIGLSINRIKKIRSFKYPMAESQAEVAGAGFNPGVQGKKSHWLEVIYHDLDPTDQQIMEYSFGMFGKPQLSNQSLATKLGLSPGAISQRKAKIQKYLDDEVEIF